MKKNKILGWLAAVGIIAGTCLYVQASGPEYMDTIDPQIRKSAS